MEKIPSNYLNYSWVTSPRSRCQTNLPKGQTQVMIIYNCLVSCFVPESLLSSLYKVSSIQISTLLTSLLISRYTQKRVLPVSGVLTRYKRVILSHLRTVGLRSWPQFNASTAFSLPRKRDWLHNVTRRRVCLFEASQSRLLMCFPIISPSCDIKELCYSYY